MGDKKEGNAPAPKQEVAPAPKREAEATSSETLKDVEAGEKVSTGAGAGAESSRLETSSPDPETGGGRADGGETGGPM